VAMGSTVFAATVLGQGSEAGSHAGQPYAGQDARAVSTLSAADIADLVAGRGWGLAKPAELNGYPGPAHVLELADRLQLTPEQRRGVEASFAAMQKKAQALGPAYIEAERALDRAFRSRAIDRAMLARLLAATERARAALREVHLAAHLETSALLDGRQRALYATLRGYGRSSGHGSGSGSGAGSGAGSGSGAGGGAPGKH
jgi:Spy/CpxP family protein refolding chaperone